MSAHVQPALTSQVAGLEERRRIIDSALGTTLAEGVSPGPEVIALSERYIAGEITLQEMGSLVRAMSGL
jgi:hypothetical protein